MGGLKRWLSAGPISAEAVVTLYDDAGKAFVNKHRQLYNIAGGTLSAGARLPEGRWTAELSRTAAPVFRSGVAMPAGTRRLLVTALQTTLHRVRGPMNFFDSLGPERPGLPRRVRVASMDLFRVGVQGAPGGVKAYYFDAQTYLLRLVTAGSDEPGKDGTVTLYTYRMCSNGMAFPSRLAVMKIGQHVLVGEKPVLEVDFHRVRF
jgi:hypothetical protein